MQAARLKYVWHGHAVAVRTSNTVIRNHDELTYIAK